jgi:16S rRNA (uracil1498-N3)-methyltransferase
MNRALARAVCRCYAFRMPHVCRFHIPPDSDAGSEIALPTEEAHHALHVVRARPGERVVLFDGRGREIQGSISRTTHRDVFIAPAEERHVPAPGVRLTLLQAWLLRKRSIEYVIQHGTEIGVSHFRFFRARHSEKAPRVNPKWERYAVEACKQCGRAWLPAFDTAPDLQDALAETQTPTLIATQHLPPVPLREALRGSPKEIALLIGPEGDFASEEIDCALDRGAIPISLGLATYRSEVAATLAAALILYESGVLGAAPFSTP